jgi:hypothetical protein
MMHSMMEDQSPYAAAEKAVEQAHAIRSEAQDKAAQARLLRQQARDMQVRIEQMQSQIEQARHSRSW